MDTHARMISRGARRPARWPRESGATAVITAIVLMLVGGFLALTLNLGHLMSVRGQLQNACDAAALAGAKELDGTNAGLARARDQAFQFASRYSTDKVPVVIDPNADIVLGVWDFTKPKASAFTPMSAATPLSTVNAVLVRDGREAARGSAVPFYFGAFYGNKTQFDVGAAAVAVGGGPGQACAVPFVLADCLIQQPDGTIDCGKQLVFTNANIDTVGFTNLANGVNSVNPPTVISILNNNCQSVGVGDDIGVQNGNDLNKQVVDALKAYIARNGPSVTMPIVHPASCPSPQFNGLEPVVGFATLTITAVKGDPHPEIDVALDCSALYSGEAGGESFGTQATKPKLVR